MGLSKVTQVDEPLISVERILYANRREEGCGWHLYRNTQVVTQLNWSKDKKGLLQQIVHCN